MNIKKKLLISPLDINTTPIVRYRDLLQNYTLVGAVAPTGWGYENKDVNFIDGGQETAFTVNNDFEEKIKECDSVLFNFSNHGTNLSKYLKPQIELASNMGKEVLISDSCNSENKKNIEEFKNLNNVTILNNIVSMEKTTVYKELFNINTPIVLVVGLGERCNKFETQLSVKEYFEQSGYNVCLIGSKGYSKLFDSEVIPSFLFDNQYDIEEKIYLFNHYVKELERTKAPDVFVIGIPGGIMPFNQKETNHFGVLSYIASNAFRADAVVMNLYFDFYTDEYFKEMYSYCKYKYDFNVICHVIANTKYDLNLENIEEYLTFLSLDSRFTVSNISEKLKTKRNIYNVFKDRTESNIPKSVYDFLTSNVNRIRYV